MQPCLSEPFVEEERVVLGLPCWGADPVLLFGE